MNCELCRVKLDERDCCPECGTYHGEPCGSCGARGYHAFDCTEQSVCLAGNPTTGDRPCGDPECVCAPSYLPDEDGYPIALDFVPHVALWM